MDKNIDSYTFGYERTDSELNWRCKVCKNLTNDAGMYLCLREHEKNKKHNEAEQRADLIYLKYYYALLHLFDEIHNFPECPNPEHPASESADQKCSTPEFFDFYRKIYITYTNILIAEKGLKKIDLKCSICTVLPYTIFNDLNMVAKNMYNDDMGKTQKLELDATVTNYYLQTLGSCERWEKCSCGADWLELMSSAQILRNYLETKDRNALHISLSNWNRVRAIDNLLNTGFITNSRDFKTQDIPLSFFEGKKLVYLDFCVYQLYEDNGYFHTELDTYAEMDTILFVYSPTHMEEVCRMNDSEFESERRKNISKICGNREILPDQDGYLKIFEEPIDTCFARAKKLQTLNMNAEEEECARFEALEEQTCRLLEWDKKELEKRIKLISPLTSIQLFDPKNETIDNMSLNKVFRGICGSQVSLEEFKDYSKKQRTFREIREAIRLLYMLMSALGYHRNKIQKSTKFTHNAFYPTYHPDFYRYIRSGFYDIDHLCYASICDCFVTSDQKLALQAKEIYRYLGCETYVYYKKRENDSSLPIERKLEKSDAP